MVIVMMYVLIDGAAMRFHKPLIRIHYSPFVCTVKNYLYFFVIYFLKIHPNSFVNILDKQNLNNTLSTLKMSNFHF